jgi:hypothetical protein
VTIHRNIDRLVAETVRLFEGVPRAPLEGGVGLDAMGLFVVSFTNEPRAAARLVKGSPAPSPTSPISYARFLEDFVGALRARFPF